MKDLTTIDKEVLERMIDTEFNRLHKEGNQIDNARYLHLIELAEKLYLRNDFINDLKNSLNG